MRVADTMPADRTAHLTHRFFRREVLILRAAQFLAAVFLLQQTRPVLCAPWSLSVVNENGQPVQARVRIFPGIEEKPLFLETDKDGKIAGDLRAHWRDYLGRVFVYAPDHAPCGGALRTGNHTVKLGLPHALTGRVTDDAGRPLAGVNLCLTNFMRDPVEEGEPTLENSVDFYLTDREHTLFAARTGADGRYEIHNVPEHGTAIVVVDDPLWESSTTRVNVNETREAADIKTRPGARLSGKILHADGTPAANLGVYALSTDNYASTETDKAGHYVLGGLKAGGTHVRTAQTPLENSEVAAPVFVTAVTGIDTPVPDIHLTHAASIQIKTVPAVSELMLDFRAEKTPPEQAGFSFFTDEGISRAWVLPGTYHLTIQQPPKGWIVPQEWPKKGLKVEVSPGENPPIEIKLRPALQLTGTVVNENGAPLAGVIISPTTFGLAVDDDVPSDARGNFTLGSLKPGDTSLSAGPQWEIVKPKVVKIPAAGAVTVIVKKIYLVPLRGRVVDTNGTPVEGAQITAEWLVPYDDEGGSTSAHKQTRSGKDGRYEIPDLPANAEVTLQIKKAKYRFLGGGEPHIDKTITAIDGNPMPNPNASFNASDLVLVSLQREATGRVLDAAGQPVANAIVAALGGGLEEFATIPRNIARTDKDGRFKLQDLPAGDLGFVAGSGDGFGQVHSPSAALPDITLQPQPLAEPDAALAKKVVFDLIAESDDNYYARETLPYVFPAYDMKTALEADNALHPGQPDKTGKQRILFSRLIDANPEEAKAALPAMLPQLEQGAGGEWFAYYVFDVASLLPHSEKETVDGEPADDARLRSWVRAQYKLQREKLPLNKIENNADQATAFELTHLALLANRLGDPQSLRMGTLAIKIAARYAVAQKEDTGMVPAVVEGLARGGASFVDKIFEAIPLEMRADALGRAVPEIAKADLPGALRLLELIPKQIKTENSRSMNADPEWAFGLAAKAILRRMQPGDAAAALALARRVTTEDHLPEALALAARLQPKAQAAPLWWEAFELAAKRRYDNHQSAIVAIALGSDEEIAKEMLRKMDDDFFTSHQWNMGDAPTLPAFYLAQLQPGRARALLEWRWAQAQNTIGGMNGPIELKSIAMAMSAVDTQRALQMAASIPPKRSPDGTQDFIWRWEAQRKIAQYLAASLDARRGINFSRWGASDTWTPGEDTGW